MKYSVTKKARLGVPLLLFLLGAAGPAGAQDLCSILGPAMEFAVVGTKAIRTRTYATVYHGWGYQYIYDAYPGFNGPVCAQKIRAANHGSWLGMVATRDTRTAITFGRAVYDSTNGNLVFGDIVTGGGKVRAVTGDPPIPYDGVIDTTGTHPLVAKCQQAMSQASLASTAFGQGLLPGEPPEAARAIIDLGDVSVASGDSMVLQTTAPVTVYRIRNLKLENAEMYHYYYSYHYIESWAELVLDAADDELLIVNVTGRLLVGRGAVIDGNPTNSVINLVGRGKKGSMRKLSGSYVPILAPERTIKVLARGGGSENYYGLPGWICGRNVRVEGSAFVGYYGYGYCSSAASAEAETGSATAALEKPRHRIKHYLSGLYRQLVEFIG